MANTLNRAQREAVLTTEGPLLVLAGAGTGKTRVITYRIVQLLNNGVPPEAILAVTFTNKAAREMRERVAGLLRRATLRGGPTVCTFHRFGVTVLREHAGRAERRRSFSIYDRTDAVGLLREILRDLASDREAPDPELLHQQVSAHKTRREGGEASALFDRVVTRYEEALRAQNAFDLDDLIVWPVRLLRDKRLRAAYHARYRYVLVDEYQDTSQIQYELLRRIVGPGRNVCVVGDDDQSIYRFRGALREKILSFRRDFPGAKVIALEQNYRSTNRILAAAHGVIARSARRHDKKLFSRLGDGEPVRCVAYEDQTAEAEGTVDEIYDRHAAHGEPLEQAAILFRSVFQARPFEERLRFRGIDYTLSGGRSWYDRKEVKDVLAYLRLVVNARDDGAFLRIVNVPRRGVGPKTVAAVARCARERSAGLSEVIEGGFDSPGLAGAARDALAELASHLAEARRIAAEGRPGEAAWQLIRQVRYREAARALYGDPNTAELRVRAVDILLHSLNAFLKTNPHDGLAAFIERLTLEVEVDQDQDERRRGLNLMTIHSAKGLEFDTVYIPGFEEGILPHEKSIAEGDEGVEEERRLLYVAMTRARRRLAVSYCLARRRRQETVEVARSRFFHDIPAGLLNEEDPRDLNTPLSPEEGLAYFRRLREVRQRPPAR
jgi:superfamily I DNA/RNA helicase